ncbi:MAG: hypothetical protein AB1742_08140 [bacterium]
MFFLLSSAFAGAERASPRGAGEQPPPGFVADTLSLTVSGRDVPRSVVYSHLKRKLARSVQLQPGAAYSLLLEEKNVPFVSFPLNSRLSFAAPVRLSGNGYREITRSVNVIVRNLVLEDVPGPAFFHVSNSPEEVGRAGKFFDGELGRLEGARFLFHHKNVSGSTLYFVFVLENRHDVPAEVALTAPQAGIARSEMKAGHKAAAGFLTAAHDGVRVFEELPPGAQLVAYRETFPPGETLSVLCEAVVTGGRGVRVSARLLSGYLDDERIDGVIDGLDARRARGVFPAPAVEKSAGFTAGGAWTYLSIGDDPLRELTNGGALMGNYGVTHRMRVTVFNPGKSAEKVKIFFFPGAGPASGTFFIDGERVEIPNAKGSETVELKTLRFEPGERREVVVETMPEPGSYYPARIVFGARAAGDGRTSATDD